MHILQSLLDSNRKWSEQRHAEDPEFFSRLSHQQNPDYLWIGCSDSRVPANQIIGLDPGEVFVHRNVANVVAHTDLNCLSVLQFAVEVLKVEHVIVCGHYGCGGVEAAMENTQFGLIDNWLRHIKDVYLMHKGELDPLAEQERLNMLCELNVAAQVAHVCQTTIVQNAWHAGQELTVHGMIYSLDDGLLRELGTSITSAEQVEEVFRMNY